jgi:hydrogenase/urease accessory protein HupE
VKNLLVLLTLFFSAYGVADDFRPASLTLQPLIDNQFKVTWKVPIKNRQLPQLNVKFDALTQEYLPKRSRSVDGAYVQSWLISRENNLSGLTVSIEGLKGSGYEVIFRVLTNGTYTNNSNSNNNQSNQKNSNTLTKILNSDEPFFTVPENQSIATKGVFVSYVTLGFEHILAGLDHLLFVFALILLVVSRKKLIWTITCFTLAHSITLAAVTLDWLYFPGPPVEAVIALSIIFLAKEIIIVHRGKPSTTAQYPWLVAFIFGLLHGMGFASALSDIGVPENEVFMALFSFNVGVELGQLTFVLVVLTLMSRCKNRFTKLPNWTAQIPAYVIGCTASFWLLQRLVMF